MSSSRPARAADAVLAAALIALALAWLLAATRLPEGFAQSGVGPGRFPSLATTLLALAAGIVVLQAILAPARGEAPVVPTPRSLLFIASAFLMVFAFDRFGFYPAAAIWLVFSISLLGKWRVSVPVALGFCVFVWGVFEHLLGVPLP